MNIKETLCRVVDRAVIAIDDAIAGDGGASVELTPEQQADLDKWLKEKKKFPATGDYYH